jgi:hypothetical protein
MIDIDDIDNWFKYHSPTPDQIKRYKTIRDAARDFALIILHNTPSCPDQTVAIRKLRDTVMAANLSIACNEPELHT